MIEKWTGEKGDKKETNQKPKSCVVNNQKAFVENKPHFFSREQ